ncbi:MAG: hypothetical protein JWO44_927 [Bacteroidetes bacterium]|nr:hypothetical protein [Bacteroidota bacterium]
MNKYVYESYRKLSDTERAEFAGRFKNSPTVSKFIKFVERSPVPNFKTAAAIDSVYGDEKEQTAYNVLENRFFKLRKKMLDELESLKKNDTSLIHPEEELKFLAAKQLMASENKETAYKQLAELEKACWERNIFELLPAVIDQLIFCNQSFNRIENNKELFIRQEKAIGLLNDISICGMTTRKIYEINFTKGVKYATKELGLMRNLASKHKQYPRFLMCYHHVSAYYKLGSKDYEGDMQVVSRHLSAFKKLQAAHPMVPLMNYKVNYVQQQHMHFNQMIISFHFNRCEFEETYQVMKEVWELINREDSVLKMYKTEASYYNMVTAQSMAHRYTEALDTINDFMAYLKTNHQTDKLVLANVLKARIYTEVYPQTYKMDPAFLTEQVEEYVKVLKKSDNRMISLDQTLVLKAKLLVLKGSYEKALKVVSDPVAQEYLSGMKLLDVTTELIRILQENSGQKNKKLAELAKAVQLAKHKASTPAQFMHIYWMQHYLKHLLR